MIKTINQVQIQTDNIHQVSFLYEDDSKFVGTGLQGYILTTKATIEKLLGPPDDDISPDGKTTCEWQFVTRNLKNNFHITIYNWKDYDGDSTKNPEHTYEWHIGGNNYQVLHIVKTLMPQYRVTSYGGVLVPSIVPTQTIYGIELKQVIFDYIRE